MTPQCQACRFWKNRRMVKDGSEGECRRRAPIPTRVNPGPGSEDRFRAQWPLTMSDEWCGDFQPLPSTVQNGQ